MKSQITMLRMPRMPRMRAKCGRGRSSIYADVANRVMVSPVALGPRCVGWVEAEVDAVLAARIAGRSTEEIRDLVAKLEAARRAAA